MKYDFFNYGKVSELGKLVNRRFTAHIVKEVLRHRTHLCNKLVEIGPGRGAMLDMLSSKGFLCSWVDPSPCKTVEKKYPGRISRVPDKMLNLESNYYDFVLAVNVLEHVYNHNEAVEFVKWCNFVLKKHGSLVLCVPDYQDYGTKFYTIPDHSYPTTPHGIGILISEYGFEKVSGFHIYGGIKGDIGKVLWFTVRLALSILWYILPDSIRYSRAFEKADQIYRGNYVSVWRKSNG